MILQAAIGVGVFLGVFVTALLIIARLIVWIFQIAAWFISGRSMPYHLYMKKRNAVWWTFAILFALIGLAVYLLRDYTFL